jgi:hypothetical protein
MQHTSTATRRFLLRRSQRRLGRTAGDVILIFEMRQDFVAVRVLAWRSSRAVSRSREPELPRREGDHLAYSVRATMCTAAHIPVHMAAMPLCTGSNRKSLLRIVLGTASALHCSGGGGIDDEHACCECERVTTRLASWTAAGKRQRGARRDFRVERVPVRSPVLLVPERIPVGRGTCEAHNGIWCAPGHPACVAIKVSPAQSLRSRLQ